MPKSYLEKVSVSGDKGNVESYINNVGNDTFIKKDVFFLSSNLNC